MPVTTRTVFRRSPTLLVVVMAMMQKVELGDDVHVRSRP
jgi:hypothetical protein